MNLVDLHIPMTFFESLKEFKSELALMGYSNVQIDFMFKNLKGIAWSKTADNEYMLLENVLKYLEEQGIL